MNTPNTTTISAPVDVLADYRVTYRDWNGEHTFTVQANSLAAVDTVVADWKGGNPAIAIVRVVEVFRHDGLTCCAACGQEMPHMEDASGFVEFPDGEFPPQANVGPLV